MRDAMTANRGSLLTTSNLIRKTHIIKKKNRRLLDAREFQDGQVGRKSASPPGYSRNQFSTRLSHLHTSNL